MDFGVPSKKRVATIKYPDTPVITLLPYEGENTSRKIEFNKKAYALMNLTLDDINDVAFSFNKSNFADNSVVNANSLSSDASLKVAKNGKISNKAHYEEIKTRYGAKMEDELELTIVDSGREFNGIKVFKLVTLESLNKSIEEEKAKGLEVEDEVVVEQEQTPVAPSTSFGSNEEEEEDKLEPVSANGMDIDPAWENIHNDDLLD